MTGSDDQERAERLLDELADELVSQGLVEFVDFYMPHRVVVGQSPLPASEVYGIRYDADAPGFRVYHRDMGVKRVLLERGSWDEARALYIETITTLSPFGRKKP
ncbi:MAG TPA: hypothetical protein VD764_06225 [Nocardioides sp.]|nr:hypothetical protein [Nocardioides sp.]